MQAFGKYFAVAALGLSAASNSYALEEFYATPGSRAMAMGGAFAAFAADSSSIWYNPAGLGFQAAGTTDFTVEYGNTIVGREDLQANDDGIFELYETSSELKYVGFSTKGAGIAYFRPYDFYTWAYNVDTGETAEVQTSYQELKFGFGYALNEEFSIGGTLDMIVREGEVLQTSCTDYFCADSTDLESTSFGATLGALYKTRIIEQSATELRLSAVYRSGTFAEEELAISEFEDLPARPTTISWGAAIRGPLTFIPTENWAFFGTLTTQYDTIEYDAVLYRGSNGSSAEVDHTRLAFGLELQVVTPGNLNLFLRMGTSESEADGDKVVHNGIPDFQTYSDGVESTSYGAGIILGSENQFVIDYAMEDRTILGSDFTNVAEQEETLHSVSLSVLF